MNRSIVCFLLGILGGCVQQIPVVTAARLDDAKAGELAKSMWGKVEYAPKQYAGFAYDSTGIYGNLHGVNPPDAITIRFHAVTGVKTVPMPPDILFTGSELGSVAILQPTVPPHHSGYIHGFSEDEFRWLGDPLFAQQARSYGRSFWVSWKAIGLDGPSSNGDMKVCVGALTQRNVGASFLIRTVGSK